jgi:hypothetical protein
MDWDSLPTLDDLLEQNLLTPEQGQELEQWFQASCRANLPIELPPSLYQALDHAVLLAGLKPGATRH